MLHDHINNVQNFPDEHFPNNNNRPGLSNFRTFGDIPPDFRNGSLTQKPKDLKNK